MHTLFYDYIHISKNLRNNWITELSKELSFSVDEKEYVAKWSDVQQLYEEDKKNPIRLTKLTYTSVYPKLLQRQSVPFVSQVFNDKTRAAFGTLKNKLNFSEGTLMFITIVSLVQNDER